MAHMPPVGVIAENVNLVLLDRKIQVFFFLSTSLVSVNSPFYFEDLSQKNRKVSMVVTYVIIVSEGIEREQWREMGCLS